MSNKNKSAESVGATNEQTSSLTALLLPCPLILWTCPEERPGLAMRAKVWTLVVQLAFAHIMSEIQQCLLPGCPSLVPTT